MKANIKPCLPALILHSSRPSGFVQTDSVPLKQKFHPAFIAAQRHVEVWGSEDLLPSIL
jgi:hypothetical protein